MVNPASSNPKPIYAAAALTYFDAGWRGPLPLPPGAKAPVPTGYTGRAGEWPNGPDIYTWMEDNPAGNIALRLPETVIGIDIDAYPGKKGAYTLVTREHEWGKLPATWRTTAREDGVSGIRFFTIPAGLAWPNEVGDGIEIVRFAHRYAVVWPSIHPDTGKTYRWLSPDGATRIDGAIPTIDELPNLPAAWVEGLTGGREDTGQAAARRELPEIETFLTLMADGPMCRETTRALTTRAAQLENHADNGARHDTVLAATQRLVHLGAEGHAGIPEALTKLRAAFLKATTGSRKPGEAETEWDRQLLGAFRHIHTVDATDPCDDPFAGLINKQPEPAATKPAPEAPRPPLAVETEQHAEEPVAAPEAPQGAETVEEKRDALLQQELERQRAQRQARRLLDQEETAGQFRAPTWRETLAQELAIPDEDVAYKVDQVLPVGGNVLLAAQFKSGKTTLINNLARAIADNEPFLDAFSIHPDAGRVALWNYEVDERQYRRWLRDMNVTNQEAITVLNLRGYRLPLINKHAEDWAVAWLEKHEIDVWVVDPFARAFTGSGKSENDNTEVGAFLDALDVIKERAGVSELVMPTHTGRAEQEHGSERARGATRLDDWADVRWLLMKDNDDNRFFRATGRDVEVPEGQLEHDPDTRLLSLVEGSGRHRAASQKYDRAVLEIITANPGIIAGDIKEKCRERFGSADNTAINNAKKRLVYEGRIREEKGHGRAVCYYPLSPADLIN